MTYTPEFEEQVRQWAETRIPTKRLPHVRGVVELVYKVAQKYAPEDVMLVRRAGWFHDAAKAIDDTDLLVMAEHYGWELTSIERQTPMLLHGAMGYLQANEVFGFNDPRLQSACVHHTTGAARMSITDKIVFLGDAIEEITRNYPGVVELRHLAMQDLDAAILRYVDNTLVYLVQSGKTIDPRVVELRNELLNQKL
jgi:predicted HD superfamily hydrolase involved in NAD metabolism